uniref:Uncharacterized protein n=1 Tax=Arundo donax TaxID=35708 RepID=A0A0A9TP48_ARUDO
MCVARWEVRGREIWIWDLYAALGGGCNGGGGGGAALAAVGWGIEVGGGLGFLVLCCSGRGLFPREEHRDCATSPS